MGPAFTTTDGITYATGFDDVTVLGTRKLFGRIGLLVKNDSGTSVEYARAGLRLDFEGEAG
jgi:hypothetical protein